MKELLCPNCGAKLYVHADRCPYCGYINVPGAEEKYMGSLENIREKLDNVDEEAAKEYSRDLSNNIKRIIRIVAILIVITSVILVIRGVFRYMFSYEAFNGTEADQMNEMMWQREKFAEFDALYEAGDYEALVEAVSDPANGRHEVYSWKHWNFASIMFDYYNLAKKDVADLDAGDTDFYLYTNMIYVSFKFYYEMYGYYNLTDDEQEVIAEAREDVLDIIHNRLNFTDEKMEELNREYDIRADGYVSFDKCKKIAKKYKNQFK